MDTDSAEKVLRVALRKRLKTRRALLGDVFPMIRDADPAVASPEAIARVWLSVQQKVQ
jgi:hypothetical protein